MICLPHCDKIRFGLLRLDKQKVAVQNSVDRFAGYQAREKTENFTEVGVHEKAKPSLTLEPVTQQSLCELIRTRSPGQTLLNALGSVSCTSQPPMK